MATVEELFDDRTESVGGPTILPRTVTAEVPYVVFDAADEDEVKIAALAAIPDTYAGIKRTAINIVERVSATTWKLTARYEEATPAETGDDVFAFDTGGGTAHITQSKQTMGRYGPQNSDELGGAIGYDGERVAGVDIVVPVYNWSETHYLADAVVTPAYRTLVYQTTGLTNLAGFKTRAAGEVLFLGAQGSRRDDEEDWEITYRFAAQPNRTGLVVGDITGINKDGWQYLWVQYGDDVDGTAKVRIKKPVAVYVERVYDPGDFSLLGIGT